MIIGEDAETATKCTYALMKFLMSKTVWSRFILQTNLGATAVR
jgi:hypothetical protein